MTKSLSSALFPLTQSQLGIYFESVKHPEKLIYHFPTLIRLDGVESVDELHEALKKVVKAFPSMSARIVTDDAGNPLWKDCSVSQPIEITIEEMKDSELMNNKQNLVTPFGFDDKPLGTLKIIKTEKGIYLFFDFHHTLFDGYTLKLFLRSLDTALRELKLEGETVSVCELAYREQKERESGKLKECKNNYGTFLEGADTAFDILPDISSPNIIDNDSFSKIRVNLGISTEKYKNFCKENNLPLSVTATSAIGIVVQMLNRRQDVTFATVYHGRKNHDYENTFGMMVKTLPVRVRTEKSTTIKQLLTRVKKDLKTARDNDLYSFVDAAADFGVNSDFLFGFQGDFLDLPDVKREKPVIIPVEMLATGSKITAQMFFIDSECILEIEYRKDIFSEGLMKTLGESFGCILTELMESPADTPVSELSLVEKDKLPELKRLASGGKVKGNDWLTIPQMFRAAAKNYPDHTAVVFRDKKLTYEELDSITDKLANVLHENYGVCQGKVVGVMIERSELMAIYPLAIMKAGGAYMPLDPHFPEERLMFMIEDASVDILLADNEITDNCIPSYAGTTITASILDCLPESSQTSVVETSPDAPMVILYTSGSTGKPKGVILQQKNIVTYIKAYTELTSMTSVDHVGGYAAFGFDAHMMDIYPTLSTGATLYIFDSEIRLDLTAMHDYMEKEKLTVMFMTTQIAWQMATLFEFSTLRVLSGGGEKLPPLSQLPYMFYNLYGPTECSVAATSYLLKGYTDGKDIGRPLPGYEVRILDPYMRFVPKGVVGELVIMGNGVGEGYLNRPELSAEKFITIDGERAYRTGDNARYMDNGDIEFIGRSDGLVKLRGLRIELGEIEAVATKQPAVNSFAAAVKNVGNMEMLIGYYTTSDENLSPDQLKDFMSTELTEFMVPEVLIKIDQMPLTPNGKIDRRKLPDPETETVEMVLPESDIEKKIYEITKNVLGHEHFGVTTNLLSVGLTSLMAMRLVAAIMKNTGMAVTAKTVMKSPTIKDLVKAFESDRPQQIDSSVRKASRRYYPLTENQRGVYIDWEMNRMALQYNIPQAFKFGPNTDAERLKQAILKAIKAHPGLLTRMTWRKGEIMQEAWLDDNVEIDIKITALDKMPDSDFFQSLIRPFDLFNEPLFRCELFTFGKSVYMLLDTHHIIFDGMSAMVLLEDIRKAYKGEELTIEPYSALEHALHEEELLESAEYEKAEKWFDALLGESESTSYPRSSQPDNDIAGGMGRIKMKIKAEDIRNFCQLHGITLSNYLLSAFLQVLHRLIRESTIQITTINNGRNDIRLLSSTGMFVKTLPVVSKCEKPKSVSPAQFASDIQKQFLTTQEYDFFPFTTLVETKGVRPEIMYVYEGGIDLSGDDGNRTLATEQIPLALDTAKVPLTLLVFENQDKDFEFVFEYDTSCYGVDDMTVLARMTGCLARSLTKAETVADGVMADSAALEVLKKIRPGKVCDIPYQSMHGEMEKRADENPEKTALIACDRTLSYKEFDNECNRIANALIKRGVTRGDRIVILLPRKACLITGIYGTMKAGATYIPCDTEYPAERIRLITEDSGARYIITTADRLHDFENAVDISDLLQEKNDARPNIQVGPDDIAYMIYTSGSTGRPKGVMIQEKAISNYLYGYYDLYYKNRPDIKVEMLIVTISFDASLNNLGCSLTCGHTLVLANEEECKDVVMLAKLMLRTEVDSIDITPSRLDAMLDLPEFREAISQCKHVNIGGEGFQTALVVKLFDAGFRGKAINEYGPTETTVGSNQWELSPYSPVIAGPPFYNDSQRVVDAWGGELPVGAIGELYIFGRGLGLGYNNLPEKTAEAYVEYQGERAYRTGDLAKWTPDGNIVILGRIDHQVKLRGLRIELGEIESVALQFEGIGKVAANVCEVNKIQHLCLYYTSAQEIDTDKLREFLASRLTEYMVPDSYIRIDKMPLTPNGKTNRKALPLPDILPGAEYVKPEGKLECMIADAFTSVLGNDRTGANDDFFAIGGTSISAIKVVAAISLAGYSVTYKNVFEARTPRALAELIKGKKSDATSVTPTEVSITSGEEVKEEFKDILERNTIDAFLTGEKQELGDVLLTGATGFMGIHMLHELLVNHDNKIYCLMRRKGDISPESRLKTLLFYYFDSTFEEEFVKGRIEVVEGDVTTQLPPDITKRINVQSVINCAANVKHFSAGNDIELVNVESVRNLIYFCLEKDCNLIHVSTVSIAGESVNGYPDPNLLMTEQMMNFGQSLANQYVSSKYNAEQLILTAVRDEGLKAKIMRVGNLSARAEDGEFQINFNTNAFMGRLKAYVALGCVPYATLDAPCEFSPIDEVCKAILLLSTTTQDMVVFHPCNNHRLPLGDVLNILNEIGLNVTRVENDEFMKAEREAMDNPEKVNALQPLLAYDSDKSSRTTFIRYDAGFTNQILYRLGFNWNLTSREYVLQFLKAIDSLNFFDI